MSVSGRLFQTTVAAAKADRLYRKYRPYTMVYRREFIETLVLARQALDNPELTSGAVIECGTWRGGMSAALVETGGFERDYYFFDSFEGLPPTTELDGSYAKEWQSGENNYNNCTASLAEFQQTIDLTGCPKQRINVVPGFFDKSFVGFDPPPIAVLRLDADWYDSTMICLQKFWQHVLPNGLILIDDYHVWDGCSRAVHDFLSMSKATERIRQGRLSGVAFINKRLGQAESNKQ